VVRGLTGAQAGEDGNRMSSRADAIITAVDELPAAERDKVVAELLRRVAMAEHAAPTDDELLAAADQVFQALDRRENSGR